ncbi:adenine deaminase [Bacteroidia bacterium]|nr:adenine deaminase [Bacteroidia bacterium]
MEHLAKTEINIKASTEIGTNAKIAKTEAKTETTITEDEKELAGQFHNDESEKTVEGNIIDIHNRRIFSGELHIKNGRICQITENTKHYTTYICPGFVDAHVHIESSMLTPENFADLVILNGTIACVADPHEIANVMGIAGIEYMQQSGRRAAIKIFFGIPSCVPATPFDSAGAELKSSDVEKLAQTGNFFMLSEMMNVPGVLFKDVEVMKKIELAHKYNLPIDGHAPGLRGNDLKEYIQAGITTDHEATDLQEAQEKITNGMKILIREGSAAKNYDGLKSLIKTNPNVVMFCTDDAHPDEILKNGHIDKFLRKSIAEGYDLFDCIRIASLQPVIHYHLPVGLLKVGDFADFIRLEDIKDFKTLEVFVQGELKYSAMREGVQFKMDDTDRNVDRNKESLSTEYLGQKTFPNKFNHDIITEQELKYAVTDSITAIDIHQNQLVTEKKYFSVGRQENFESDTHRDILKIVYLNRYLNKPPRIAYISGVGLKKGAFGSSIAHDSHNILAVGTSDKDLTEIINEIIRNKGALAVKTEEGLYSLPLPVGGIMSTQNGFQVAREYERLNKLIQASGSTLQAPFMTLAFMSLLVIPEIKLGEEGLFDYAKFDFIRDAQ